MSRPGIEHQIGNHGTVIARERAFEWIRGLRRGVPVLRLQAPIPRDQEVTDAALVRFEGQG